MAHEDGIMDWLSREEYALAIEHPVCAIIERGLFLLLCIFLSWEELSF